MQSITFRFKQSSFIFSLLLFALILGISLVIGKFYSIDGPAHMYNVKIMTDFLTGGNNYAEYFKVNSWTIPNNLSHFILMGLCQLFSMEKAEIIFQFLLCVSIPLSIVSFLKNCGTKLHLVHLILLIIVPFNFFLLMGFYNYLLAVALMFWTLACLSRYMLFDTWWNRKLMLIFILFLLSFQAHVFVFIFLCVCSVLLVISYSIASESKINRKKLLSLIPVTILPVFLTVRYLAGRDNSLQKEYKKSSEILTHFVQLDIFGLLSERERLYTYLMFISLFFLLSAVIFLIFQKLKSGQESWRRWSPTRLFFVLVFLMFIVSAFSFPDSDGHGGFITYRLIFFFYLFLIAWLISEAEIVSAIYLVAPFIVLAMYLRIDYYRYEMKKLAALTDRVHHAIEDIPEGSLVFPIDATNHWMLGHLGNHLTYSDKKIIILENYEATVDYFPLRWISDRMPFSNFQSLMLQACSNERFVYDSLASHRIDYLFVAGQVEANRHPCQTQLLAVKDNLELYKEYDGFKLYKWKSVK